MEMFRRAPIVAVGVVFSAALLSGAAQDEARVPPPLSPAEIEAFLLNARITEIRDAGAGVTGSQRATLTDGRLTHDAHIQSVDIERPLFNAGAHTELNFKDSYRFNIAGYRLGRLLGIDTIPVSVERTVSGKPSAVTWWVDDVQMDEKERLKRKATGPVALRTSNQIQLMRIWDELIQNRDRNQGNVLWTSSWTMWLIDHTRAFRLGRDLLKPTELTRIDRGLFDRLKGLTDEAIAEAVGRSLTREERQAVLHRRDRIVKHFEERATRVGEAGVFFQF